MMSAQTQPQGTDPRKFPFPPALPIVALLLSWGMEYFFPIRWHWPAWTFWAGLGLLTLPFSVAIWGVRVFHRHGTAVKPTGTTTQIVDSGPFRFSRNPMYLVLLISYVGAMV